ncbi:GntR family transcriptional regulator [Sinorhizobium meliloti]|uniref:GntR family transcriptional regulator n=1 Tax=Rhizobium meliloti TaxID=382 RepID=UPI000FD44C1D|nr:GntR family transcriptional regulator [Sinorhizobium meliloti]MQV20517.1 FCD domain-containing protein [Sinorhizobium meliloti]MQV32699.1 FCD domain-containing protein [Sinorhizobium meliloti]RVE85657.1 GntR family transcriptional regulator [Sinorhizobium meliloti]RVG49030.1 GntR family transcriptional regulator [Sinorhizobium meliloti]RVM03826.1 GntR family transcriptional regulator [Sinorhizobium meliloti]
MQNEASKEPGEGRIERIDPRFLTTLRDHVHRTLRTAILSGRFAPDERVNERQLAEQLGVSTTPIKEALRQLETEGLVETLPRRGVLIRFNASWAEEMILARAALESMIAHLAAKRIEKDEIQKLQEIVTRMANATEHGIADDLISLNETFHEQIHIASRCQYLSRMIERQQFYDGSIRRVIHSDPLECDKALAEHTSIAAAIISNDSDKAERVMRDHVVRSGETYLNIVFKKKEDI